MRIDSAIITGSFSVNGDTFNDLGAYSTTGSNAFTGSQNITGSLVVSGTFNLNDSATNFSIQGNTFSQTYLNSNGAIVLNPGYGGVEMVGSYRELRLNDIYANGFVSGEIRANNGVVSGSSQIVSILSPLNSYTQSNDTTNTTQNTRLSSIEIITASLATTGSNTFIGTQTITGSLFISSNLIVQGTSSLQNITASAVSIGTNLINLNTANPAIRYAGLVIGDSGSVGGSGSFLYDSVQDEMIFIHRGTSTVVTSSVVLMGPQTFDTIGSETYPTNNIIQKGTGNEHLIDSCIFDNGTTTCIKNNLVGTGTATIGSDIVLSAANPVIYGGTAEGGVSISNNTGGSYIKIFGASHATTPNTTAFINANSTVLTINASGNMGIGTPTPCSILHLYGASPTLIIQNSNTPTVGNSTNIFFRNLLSTGCIHFTGYIAGIQQSTSANTGDLSFNTYNNGSVVEGIRITAAGSIGIGTNTPCTMLHVEGQATIGCSTYRTRIDGSSSGAWISFGTLACNNLLGRTGTYDSAYVIDSNNGNISFRFTGAEKAYVNSSGLAYFCGRVCAASGIFSVGNTSCVGLYTSSGVAITSAGGNTGNIYQLSFGYAGGDAIYGSSALYGLTESSTGYNSGALVFATRALTTNTAPLERMRITSGGRVGIGTASPSTIFQVCGDITGENVAWIQNTNSSGYGALRALNNSNCATVFGIGGSGVGYPYANTGYLYTDSGVNFTFSIGGSEKMKITSAGNVGICVGSLTVAGGINAGTLYTTTQRLTNTSGNYANMVHKVQGASGGFSQVVVCVSLNGAGGWGYIINGGSTSLGSFQSGGGYTNGTINYSHGVAVGSGYTVSSPSDNVIRFVGPGGVHPFTSIQMFGSLQHDFGDAHICIYYS